MPSSVVGSFSRERLTNGRPIKLSLGELANGKQTSTDSHTHTHRKSDTQTDRLKAYWDRKTDRQMDRPTKTDKGKQID